MVPRNFPGTISQNNQRAILIHSGNREDLILSINYEIAGAGVNAKMPDRFAWIITTPTEPSQYQLSDTDLIESIDRWAMELATYEPPKIQLNFTCGPPQKSDDAKSRSGLEFGTRVKIGSYDIQPVRALGLVAVNELNQWLTQNGFPTEDVDHMRYFVEKNFTFLCIKVSPAVSSKKTVKASGQLKPLHLTFETKTPYYPLLFSARQGVFDVDLKTLTSIPIDYQASKTTLRNLNANQDLHQNIALKKSRVNKQIRPIVKEHRKSKWYLNVIRGEDVNDRRPISEWNEDVFLATNPRAKVYRRPLAYREVVYPGITVALLLVCAVVWRWGRKKQKVRAKTSGKHPPTDNLS